jgi:hypothetical protein
MHYASSIKMTLDTRRSFPLDPIWMRITIDTKIPMRYPLACVPRQSSSLTKGKWERVPRSIAQSRWVGYGTIVPNVDAVLGDLLR